MIHKIEQVNCNTMNFLMQPSGKWVLQKNTIQKFYSCNNEPYEVEVIEL